MAGPNSTGGPEPAELRKLALINQVNLTQQPTPKRPISRNQILQLSPIDHTIARSYVRVHLSFPFEGDENTQQKALGRLFHAFEVAIRRWPFLAGEVILNHSRQQDVLEVPYMLKSSTREISMWFGESAPQDGYAMWTYNELMKWGAAPGWLSSSLFTFRNPSQAALYLTKCPVMTFNQTFVEGGLILSFSFHHAVLDGPSMKQFLQVFALGCAPGDKQWTEGIAKCKILFRSCS